MSQATDTLQTLHELLWQSLEGEDINLPDLKSRLGTDSHFGDLGLDSLTMVEFFLRLQNHFNISIRQEDYPHLFSLDTVHAFVQEKTTARKAC